MLKKTIRRLGALAMVLAMAVSVFAVNASAADATDTAITEGSFEKKVSVPSDVYGPATQYTFTLATATAGENEKVESVPVSDGKVGGIYFSKNANDEKVYTYTTTTFSATSKGDQTETINYKLDASVFPKPGIYKYTLTETDPQYDGMTADTTVRYLYVYVRNATAGTGYEVYGVKAFIVTTKADGTTETTKVDGDFDNKYDKTNQLIIKKELVGAMADENQEFKFEVTITAASGNETEQYVAVRKNVNRGTEVTTEYTIVSGKKFTFYLKGDETLTITGLSANDTYTVTEDTPNDYKATWTGTHEDGEIDVSKGTTVTCTNTKESVSPTGVIMTIAPYALMVVLAGAFAVVFLSRRNRAE